MTRCPMSEHRNIAGTPTPIAHHCPAVEGAWCLVPPRTDRAPRRPICDRATSPRTCRTRWTLGANSHPAQIRSTGFTSPVWPRPCSTRTPGDSFGDSSTPLSGDCPGESLRGLAGGAGGDIFSRLTIPDELPVWLTAEGLAVSVGEFERSGFRGGSIGVAAWTTTGSSPEPGSTYTSSCLRCSSPANAIACRNVPRT
jgi:hypothetical protein